MNFRNALSRKRPLVAIDITALIDVVFLLLIFLLVTTTFRKDEHAFFIELPTAGVEEVSVTVDKTTVFVDRDGGLHLLTMASGQPVDPGSTSNATRVTPAELTTRLTTLHKKNPDQEIAVRGERQANFQKMVDVIAVIKNVGFRRIWFPYELENKAP
jgi:biopolymer transport protein ExbD